MDQYSFTTLKDGQIEKAYKLAQEAYAGYGIDTEKTLRDLAKVAISLHCWQGDDVGGFESDEGLSGGGIQATGNYPGRARTPDELRQDLDKAISLIPGTHRLNLHAMYAETGGKKVDRDKLEPKHFKNWIDWCKKNKMGLDFNPTFFSHPKADDGFTLSHSKKSVRQFWVDHAIACRKIGEAAGKKLGTPCVTNIWIPDGYKDMPVDRYAPRKRLEKSLDAILKPNVSKKHNLDAVECKLFGIGSESCVIGSHEFYLGYAVKNGTLLCLDAGHFHPTEVISDKISSCMLHVDELLLHVSRGVRWDSDHVVILSDELQAIAQEIVRNNFLKRVHIGLDFFDASINRVAAWATGTRAMVKALMLAMLEPTAMLKKAEKQGDFTTRLAMLEEMKSLPWGAVWDYYCLSKGVPAGAAWVNEVKDYEDKVLSNRD